MGISFNCARGPKIAEPAPYPPTARPTAKPRLSGNHFAITGIGVAYPNPLPKPIIPKQTHKYGRLVVDEQRKKPRLARTLPASEQKNGPILSWMLPATTKPSASITTAIVKTIDVSARVHPNCFSRGVTNTLQA